MPQNQKYNVINVENVNRDGSNDILAITIKCQKLSTKDGKKKFLSVKAMMYLRCFKTIEGKHIDTGYKNRWVDLGFTQDAFKTDCFEGCKIKDVNDLSTGVIYVNANYVDAPSVYKVTKDEDGKDVYPKVWVKGGIVGFEKYKPIQSSFTYQPSDNVIDAPVDEETGEVKIDDTDNEVTSIED